jgi:hypothetical protein
MKNKNRNFKYKKYTKGATVEDQARIGLFAVFYSIARGNEETEKNKQLRHIHKITINDIKLLGESLVPICP